MCRDSPYKRFNAVGTRKVGIRKSNTSTDGKHIRPQWYYTLIRILYAKYKFKNVRIFSSRFTGIMQKIQF